MTLTSTIVLIYVAIVIGIGFYYRNKATSTEADYWVAGGTVSYWKNAICIVAAGVSGSSFLGQSGFVYACGLAFATTVILGVITGLYFCLVLVAEPLRRSGAYTFGDFMTMLFPSKSIRLATAIVTAIMATGYLVPQLVSAGYTISSVLDINYAWAVAGAGLVFIIYVSLGGMWAVTITDLVQGSILWSLMVLFGTFLVVKMGGFSALMSTAMQNADYFTSVIFDWKTQFGLYLTWSAALISFPYLVMRLFTADSPSGARKSLVIHNFMYVIFHVFTSFVIAGVGFTIFGTGLAKPDAVFFDVMFEYMGPVLAGISVSAILCAIMSSTDALLLSVSSAIAHDIYGQFLKPDASEKSVIRAGNITSWIAGALGVVLAINPPNLILTVSSIVAGFMGAAFSVPLILGLLWPRCSIKAAFASIIFGGGSYILLYLTKLVAQPILFAIPLSIIVCVGVSLSKPATEYRKDIVKKINGIAA